MKLGQIVQVAITLLLVGGVVGYFALCAFRQSEKRGALVLKWVISSLVLFKVYRLMFVVAGGTAASPYAILYVALMGAIMAVLWSPSIAHYVADGFGRFYTGGGEIEAAACYSIAEMKRKRNDFVGAVAEIRTQLQRFPNDHAGIYLLAMIQAEDLKELSAAEETILTYVRTANPSAGRRAAVLHLLADFHIKYARDNEAARICLQQIVESHPGSEQAMMASHRLAHLVTTERMQAIDQPRAIEVKRIPLKLGLQKHVPPSIEREIEMAEAEIAHLRAALNEHPLDFDTREKLAFLVAEHHGDLDEARREIEFMLQQPAVSPRQIKRWLNLRVDLEVRFAVYTPSAEVPLRRLIELYPGSAAAESALRRLSTLKTEFRRKETSQL